MPIAILKEIMILNLLNFGICQKILNYLNLLDVRMKLLHQVKLWQLNFTSIVEPCAGH